MRPGSRLEPYAALDVADRMELARLFDEAVAHLRVAPATSP